MPVHRFKSHGTSNHRHRTLSYRHRNSLMDSNLKMFYSDERRLFSLLVQLHHIDPIIAVFIIALWLLLEHCGSPDVIKTVLSSVDSTWIRQVLMEAESIIQYLRNPATPFTGGLELTATLARAKLAVGEFADNRTKIVEFMNDVVAKGLQTAFADIHPVPNHALRYLTELVPLSQSTGSGSGSGLFSQVVRGQGLYPWTSTWTDPIPTSSRENLTQDNTRRRSRSPFRHGDIPAVQLERQQQTEGHGHRALHGPTQEWVRPFGRPLHTGLYDHEAGGSSWPRQSLIRPTEPVLLQQLAFPLVQQLAQPLVQRLLQPLVQPQTQGFYVYWEPSLGWVVAPVGPGVGMSGLVNVPQGMMLAPTALGSTESGMRSGLEEYVGYSRGTRAEHRSSRYQRMDRGGMESEGTGSEQQQESSDAGFPEGGEDRTLFVTFSRGFPVEPTVLQDYFSNEYGDIVEAVIPEMVRSEGENPLYARVLLRSAAFVNLVLQDQEKLMLKLDGRDVWVRPYTRRISARKDSLRRHRSLRPGRRGHSRP